MYDAAFKKFAVFLSAALLSLGVYASSPDPEPDPEPCSNCSYQRGPNPTTASLEADRGPYSVRTINVSRFVSGFGGGTIHYPTGTSGTMGVIAVVPGYVSYESSIEWWGPRLASHGFVVITINTSSIYDQPNSRATQLVAALDYVIAQSNSSSSAISGMVDPNRRAVIGWSMGGGGALKATADDRSIMASIPQAPYYSGTNNFNRITTPTLVIACESDSIARVSSHASPLYERIPSSTSKAFLQIRRGNHYCANSGNDNEDILGKYGVAWMKRFVDLDRRYDQFLCGVNHTAPLAINEYRSTCNYD
jgi:dienelactone hydrolase